MGRRTAILAVLACAAAALGCGADEEAPPTRPVERFGVAPIDRWTAVEEVRAELVVVADLYGLRRVREAKEHLELARRTYLPLGPLVERADEILDREVRAALGTIEREMSGRATFDFVRDRANLLRGQLLDGVLAAAVPAEARDDRSAQAAVLHAIAGGIAVGYSGGGITPAEPDRRGLESGYGRLARAQILARAVAPALGPSRDDVLETLSSVREKAFPEGLARLPPLYVLAEVGPAVERVRRAVRRRFELG